MAFRDRQKDGFFDLESLEIGIRTSMHNIGGRLLERVINSDGGDYRGVRIPCGCGSEKQFEGYRDKAIQTVLSGMTIKRAYYHCSVCKEGSAPKDEDMDIKGTSFSPGIRRMMGLVGAHHSFKQGRDFISELTGIDLTVKGIERTSEEIGDELIKTENKVVENIFSGKVIAFPRVIPTGYVMVDGTTVHCTKEWREVKLGCVFTQRKTDNEGFAVRDEDSTTYIGGIQEAESFGKRIFAEAMTRGFGQAKQVVFIADGARWTWNIADEHFPDAIQIVDLYHAREHLWNLGRELYGTVAEWVKQRHEELDKGDIELLIENLKELRPSSEGLKEMIRKEIGYFETNKERMRYKKFREMGLFVGSGVIEAGCKTVVGQRLKQSGMRWSVKGANSILALRICQLNNRWEDYWENRKAV